MIFQSHFGSGDNVAGDKVQNMTPQQTVQNLVASNYIKEAIEALYQVPGIDGTNVVLLLSRWNNLSREKNLGVIANDDYFVNRSRIVSAILSYAGSDSTQHPAQVAHAGWEPQLLQIVKDNERKDPAAAKRALSILESFRIHYDLKKTRAFFDRSGEMLREIEQHFEDFKKNLNKSENESVEKFIDRVAGLIDARVPDWPSIKEAFVLCLGRSGAGSLGHMQIGQLERIIENQPNDDSAKLRIVEAIETFLGQL